MESNFYYKTFYNKDRPKQNWLVLINGLFAAKELWTPFVEDLRKDFHILIFDGPGQGEFSPIKKVYSLDEQVDYLANLLDYLKIERPNFLGISNGGRVALRFAQRYSHKVECICVACTYIDLDTHLKCKLDSWLSASRTGGPKLRFRTSLPWIFGASYLNQISSSLEMMEENAINMDALTAELLIESALLPISIDIEKISSKILFISGKEDILTPGSELKKNIKDKKHCEFVTVPGGHACFYEYPSESLVSIRPFFMEHLNKTMLTQGKGDDLHALA